MRAYVGTVKRHATDVTYVYIPHSHKRGFACRRHQTSFRLPAKRTPFHRLSTRGGHVGCPCAASLSAARPSPRPPSPTHSFRCKAARRAPLWGPAGQAAPTAGVGAEAQDAEINLANKASEPSNGPLCAGEAIYKHGCARATAAEDQLTTSFTEWEWSWLAVGRASRMAANEAKFGLFVRKVG